MGWTEVGNNQVICWLFKKEIDACENLPHTPNWGAVYGYFGKIYYYD